MATWYHAAIWRCSGNISQCSLFVPQVFLFHLFSCFYSNFRAAIWRSFQTPISSNLISLEISRYPVSIDSDLVRFGVTVVKISCQVERWRSVGNSAMFFLINSFLSIRNSYRQTFFVGGIWDIILQSCSDWLPQSLFSWYNFLHENGQKTTLLTLKKKNETFRVFLGSVYFAETENLLLKVP